MSMRERKHAQRVAFVTPIGFVQLVSGEAPPCPHLHVERRYDSGIDPASDTAWYREYDHCHDCGRDFDPPPLWIHLTADQLRQVTDA
jgi:hypothetical protein